MVGVTADSPLVTSRWLRFDLNFLCILKIFWEGKKSCDCCGEIRKGVSEGGFGGAPGFPILSDRDLSFSASLGVARCVVHSFPLFFFKTAAFDTRGCGSPARASFIVDLSGTLRYMAAHRTDIPRCFNRSFSPPYIAQLLLFKERDRDPSAGAGFPPL